MLRLLRELPASAPLPTVHGDSAVERASDKVLSRISVSAIIHLTGNHLMYRSGA